MLNFDQLVSLTFCKKSNIYLFYNKNSFDILDCNHYTEISLVDIIRDISVKSHIRLFLKFYTK